MTLRIRRAVALALVLTFALASAPPTTAQYVSACFDSERLDKPLVIRVGVVAYGGYSDTFDKYKNLLTRVAENASGHPQLRRRKVVFRLALGSYSDVYDWYGRDLVDLAFLTPTLIANLRTALRGAEEAGQSDVGRDTWADRRLSELYVASHDSAAVDKGTGPQDPSLTHALKSAEAPRFDYRAMAAVRKDSPLEDDDDLKREAEQGNVSFLFIDPLSMSGRVLPEHFLRYRPEADARIENFNLVENGREDKPDARKQQGAPVEEKARQNSTAYTFSPKSSMEEMSKPPKSLTGKHQSPKHQVAFFSERNLDDEKYAPYNLKRLAISGLEKILIPDQALFISHGFAANKPCVEALFDVHNAESRFQKSPGGRDWLARFDPVFEWVEKLKVSATDQSSQLVALDQITDVLRGYETRHQRPARLALVLSGGGAKCAYQLGAIEALESKLGQPPDEKKENEKPVDIDLVVGTSGGAINALTVALGLTREDGGDIGLLKDTWIKFNQRDFLSPWPIPYFVLGLCSGLLQALLVLWASILLVSFARLSAAGWMKAKFNLDPSDLYRASGFFIALLALLNLALWLTKWNGMPFKTTWHIWHHAWLLLTINTLVSGLCLAAIAGLMITRVWLGTLNPGSLGRLHLVMRNVFAFGLAAALLLSLFKEETVSRSDGVDDALLKKLAEVVDPDMGPEMRDALAKEEKPERFQAVSRIISRGLERDLIITGSRLSVVHKKGAGAGQPDHTQPSDLYFYYDHGKCEKAVDTADADACDPHVPATDKRFKRFGVERPEVERPEVSGNKLMDVVVGSSSIYPIFPARLLDEKENVKIIDGGFAHNSPIDAAVTWGATHIILIEASPMVTPQESRLLYNAMNAFNHLYYQAQLLDARARGKVDIFTLRPTPSDSEDEPDLCTFDFHGELVKKAIERGRRDALNTNPHFRRESGVPIFKEVGIEEFMEKKVNCTCGPDGSVATARP